MALEAGLLLGISLTDFQAFLLGLPPTNCQIKGAKPPYSSSSPKVARAFSMMAMIFCLFLIIPSFARSSLIFLSS